MKKHIAIYFSLSYTALTFEKRVDNAIDMFFKQLDRRFEATGASCDLTRWFKFFSYDAMGLMTFSRAYGYIEDGGDTTGIVSDVKNSMLTIGPVSQIPQTKFPLLQRG
jgi:salicylate hydroxylase